MAGNPAFGKFIRKLREARRKTDPSFSLRQFAEKVEISATFLSKVETGEFDPPAADKIKRMADLLEVDADELLALAGRFDPELGEIILDQPKAIADLLRAAREKGLSADEIDELTRIIMDKRS